MLKEQELAFLLALQEDSRVPLHKISVLLKSVGSLGELFSPEKKDLLCRNLTPDQFQILQAPRKLDDYLKRVQNAQNQGVYIVSLWDEEYPGEFFEIAAFPLLLFCRGEMSCLSLQPRLTVVGSRRMSPYGQKILEDLIPALVKQGVLIVSGLAFGVDVMAHRLALQAGGHTIAIQAQGVDQGYPKRHQKDFLQIIKNGLVFSEFPDPPFFSGAPLFPRRNRLLSGLSQGVLVVEAGLKSGTLITAQFALEQNRNVYAVPGPIHSETSEGCHLLLKQGAKLVNAADDILEDFFGKNFKMVPAMQKQIPQKRIAIPLEWESPLERAIYQICEKEPFTVDELVEKSGENISQLLAVVTKMELKGLLREVSGRRYEVLK